MAARLTSTDNLLRGLGHPLRRQILREMDGEKTISPRELSGRLEERLSDVSYHCRVLERCGVLRLVSTRPVRGSVQHFYRASVDADWAQTVLGSGD
jgi:DNA-binding transcriptional ArsR family regulator